MFVYLVIDLLIPCPVCFCSKPKHQVSQVFVFPTQGEVSLISDSLLSLFIGSAGFALKRQGLDFLNNYKLYGMKILCLKNFASQLSTFSSEGEHGKSSKRIRSIRHEYVSTLDVLLCLIMNETYARIFEHLIGVRNLVGIGLSYLRN
jgi:hypothetical protein